MEFDITRLLDKYKKLVPKKIQIKRELAAYLNNKHGITISSEDIQVVNNVVHITIDPLAKSEVFLNKKEILSFLNKKFEKEAPKDIR